MAKSIFRELDPAKLRAHPRSQAIYQDAPSDELIESVRQSGILESLVLAADEKTVISGRRRRMAAIACKMAKVPCIIRTDLKNETDIREALLESNIHNPRTTEQRAREYEERLLIESRRAADRQHHKAEVVTAPKPAGGSVKPGGGSGKQPDASPVVAEDPSQQKGRAKAIAAKAVGLSQPTADAALEVLEKAHELSKAGKTEEAERIIEVLNTESVAKAKRLVEDKKPAPKSRAQNTALAISKSRTALSSLAKNLPKEVYKECKSYLKIIEEKLDLYSAK